ncbi:MAG TPA: hypothetical protein VG244_11650 [Acidimicrobiales bacterium]|nr:hypothetical protein [Acidimicrobiales bacterium]
MGRLQSWFGAARRSPLPWVVAGVVLIAALAGGIVVAILATRSTAPSSPHPAQSTRAVALGDSVPYGHGLANPYLKPQLGLPAGDVSQGPSKNAFPSLVAANYGLTMTVRPTNCHLVGDQLAISGAVADPGDNTGRDGQCLRPTQPARNLGDEIAAAGLSHHPARLVLLQDGADDIHFSACLEFQLARILDASLGLGTNCVQNGKVTAGLSTELARVRASLASAIEQIAPDAATVAVLNYYQPIPVPGQLADGTAASGLGTNLVCTGLKANASSTAAAARVVLSALNDSIAGAVGQARAHGVRNVTLVNVSNALNDHGICTADPWVFSSELVPDATLAADAEHILAAKACTAAGSALHADASCSSLVARAHQAEQALTDYVWRTAHPTAAGQRALSAVVEQTLRGRA